MNILAVGCNSVANTFNTAYKDWKIEKYLYHSIFAVCQEQNSENVEFNTLLSKSSAEFIVLDLFSLSLFINILDEDKYISRSLPLPEGANYKSHSFFNDKKACFECLDKFFSIISQKFDGKHIVLIKTKRGDKYCKGDLVRPIANANEGEFNALLNEYEDYFISKSGCHVIDVFSQYFVDAYHPFGWSQVNYETFAYDNVKHCLTHIFENKCVGNTLYIKLLRYLKYGDFLEKSFRLNWIFSNDDVVEDFISHTSVPFVKDHYNDLIKLDQNIIDSPKQLLAEAGKISPVIFSLAKWYVGLKTAKFSNLTFDSNLKKYNLTIQTKLANYVNYLARINGVANHISSTKNLEYYLPYLTSGNIKSLSNVHDIPQPTKIDIWGSCIAREVFKFINENVVLGNYIYRASGLQINDPYIDNIPNEIFEDLSLFSGSKWRSETTKVNLYRQAKDIITNTNAKWLLIDLYDFVELTYKIDEKYFIFSYDTTQMPIYKYLQDNYGVAPVGFHPYKDQELHDRLNNYADLISSIYGQNIILVNTHFSSHFISNDGEIIKFNHPHGEHDAKNDYLKYCQDYLANKLNCFVIDLTDKFLADERFVWGESPVHYETLFFEYAGKIIENIINGQQKEKIINALPKHVIAERILGILERIRKFGGKNAPKYYEILSDSIDKNIISLYNDSI